jgi:NADPH:quinone reductase
MSEAARSEARMIGPSQMKAWLVDQPGPVRSLYLDHAPVPDPGPGEARVHVHAAGLNPLDWKLITGGSPAWHYPQIPGIDVAGTIEALGAGVADWRLGERVLFLGDMMRAGAFADFVVAPVDVLARIPHQLTFEDAAALPCAGITAYHALHRRLRIHRGQTILVWGASGGVGGFAVQLARIAGLRVIAAFSGHDRDYVLNLGAHETIDRANDDIEEIVQALTDGCGVDAILNVVGAERATLDLDLLAYGGGLACVAGLPDLARLTPLTTAPSIHEVGLGSAYKSPAARRDLATMGQELAKLVANGNIKPLVSEIVGFDALPEALAQLQGGAFRGKVVAHLRN